MMDLAKKTGIEINVDLLAKNLSVPVVPIAARKQLGIDDLKQAIANANKVAMQGDSIDVKSIAPQLIESISREMNVDNAYYALQLAHQHETLKFLSTSSQTG